MLTRSLALSCIALGLLATPVSADDDVAPSTEAPAGQFATLRGVQGPKGMFSAQILLDINLSADLAGKPISLSPDLYYSISDKLQLGLVHQGPLGWQVPAGAGPSLCLTGSDNGCPDAYHNIGFDVMVAALNGQTDLSVHGSLFLDSFDPFETSLAVGVAGKAHFTDDVSLFFDPKIAIALTDRDVVEDMLYIPLELGVQAGAPNLLKLLTGIYGPLSGFGDAYRIPLGVGFVRNLNPHFDLGLRFSFDNLLGQQPAMTDRADARSLALLLNIRS